jgi:malonate-semialdehyde dehydrogenase (acetylating)/methylmalonate-semialdehyde dehydrogenase
MSEHHQVCHFIGGKQVTSGTNRFGDIYDPSTGLVTKQVPLGTSADIDLAVADAKAAFPAW